MHPRTRLGSIFAPLALAAAVGCNDINTAKDDRTGRGSGDQLPAQGPGAMGTNAATNQITTNGPGEKNVSSPTTAPPSASTPYGGSGAGVAPPVSPSPGGMASGDSNSGQSTGKLEGAGSDATTENAKPNPAATGPGTGTPPR